MERFLSKIGNIQMKSIEIVIPYFGKLPAFYEAWEKTARENLIVDLKELEQKQFDFPIALEEPYKLCD